MERGEHIFECPHCHHKDRYWYDPARGQYGYPCKKCERWFEIAVNLVAVDPAERKGPDSPLWSATVDLLAWKPGIKPSFYADLWGWPKDQADDKEVPFFSEAFLYLCIGKDAARSVLGQMKSLLDAAGIDMFEAEIAAANKEDR